jgi:hypothetical protein
LNSATFENLADEDQQGRGHDDQKRHIGGVDQALAD